MPMEEIRVLSKKPSAPDDHHGAHDGIGQIECPELNDSRIVRSGHFCCDRVCLSAKSERAGCDVTCFSGTLPESAVFPRSLTTNPPSAHTRGKSYGLLKNKEEKNGRSQNRCRRNGTTLAKIGYFTDYFIATQLYNIEMHLSSPLGGVNLINAVSSEKGFVFAWLGTVKAGSEARRADSS
jgi:hypothetical protein